MKRYDANVNKKTLKFVDKNDVVDDALENDDALLRFFSFPPFVVVVVESNWAEFIWPLRPYSMSPSWNKRKKEIQIL